jgi:mannan endo-1,4-beta-mannosidase
MQAPLFIRQPTGMKGRIIVGRCSRLSSYSRIIGVLSIILILLASSLWLIKNATENPFVMRSGSSLMLDGKPFRFSGANIYWLGLQERNKNPIYPSHFTVDDALATASLMGAVVVRSHTLGISVGCDLCVEPTLGTFNQIALQHIDYAIESARKHNIRLIIPLVDNWHHYHGGKHTFTDWRGIDDEDEFYSNPLVISDFKQYVYAILNHVNSYTGVAYKDDPTILAWETGNELSAPFDWVQKMSAYIKGIDDHHLVMDGNIPAEPWQNLNINTVDLYTAHYNSSSPTVSALSTHLNQVGGAQKVFIVGEYDWNTNKGDPLSSFLSYIEQSKVAGDLYWSLFPHDDRYGFVQHDDGQTLHYPGDTSNMRFRVNLLRNHAYKMQNLTIPPISPLGTPYITAVGSHTIAWRGASGADTYTVERSTQGANGPWTVICDRCATDNDSPWTDRSKSSGPVWYRVQGYSTSGIASAYSNVSSLIT